MNERDFAIVVAVNSYQAQNDFTQLQGPENDAADFVKWLKAEDGGALPAENVDPYVLPATSGAPPPRLSDIQEAMTRLWEHPRPLDQPIGRRLYVFLAGHGTTPSLNLALLHAFESRRQLPVCVSGTQWAECFHAEALFEELVLCMDCCRTFEATYEPPGKPCLNRMDPAASKVKRLYLLASGPGQKAFEHTVDGVVRGYFSEALLAALRGDAVDGDGTIKAARVVDCVRSALAARPELRLNQLPDPLMTPGFVLFDDREPRRAEIRVRVREAGLDIRVAYGDGRPDPIAPISVEGETLVFLLPMGKTYIIHDASGRTTLNRAFSTGLSDPLTYDVP